MTEHRHKECLRNAYVEASMTEWDSVYGHNDNTHRVTTARSEINSAL